MMLHWLGGGIKVEVGLKLRNIDTLRKKVNGYARYGKRRLQRVK